MATEEQGTDPGRQGGLFGSLKTLASTLVAIARTRLELLSTELEEERVWLSSMLVWLLMALFFAGLSIVMTTMFFVIVLWDSHPLIALGVPAIIFTLAAIFSWLVLQGKTSRKPKLFSASLAELSKDREQLGKGS